MTDTLIARLRGEVAALRAARQDYDAGHQAVADRAAEYFTEAADRLERAELVVDAARRYFAWTNAAPETPEDVDDGAHDALADALRAYDANSTISRDIGTGGAFVPPTSRTTLRREAAQRGEEVPTFDASDQHVRGLNAEEEKK